MKVWTEKMVMVELVNIPFVYHLFSILIALQYHIPNLQLLCRQVDDGKLFMIPLMNLRLDWFEMEKINPR
jgi:hypothetical protein